MTQDPDQIRADIERTRAELSADVDTLNEKVNPKYVAQRKTEQVKDKVAGVKEKVMGAVPGSGSSSGPSVKDKVMGVMPSGSTSGGASSGPGAVDAGKDKASSALSTVSGAAQAAPGQVIHQAEGNPLAAGLIAFGVGWLASSLLPATSAEQRAAISLKEHATDLAAPLQEQAKAAAQEVADNLREPAQQAAESVKSTAQDAAGNVKGEAQAAKDDVTGQAQSAKESVQGQATSSDPSGAPTTGYSGGATTPPSSTGTF